MYMKIILLRRRMNIGHQNSERYAFTSEWASNLPSTSVQCRCSLSRHVYRDYAQWVKMIK